MPASDVGSGPTMLFGVTPSTPRLSRMLWIPDWNCASGPRMLLGTTTPVMPGVRPVPWIVTISPGETMPGSGPETCRLAALRNTILLGPGGETVRLNVAVKPLALAVTTTAPALPPAVTLVDALPLASVVVLCVATVAEPLVTENETGTFATGLPVESVTFTTSGFAKAAFAIAVWLLPETSVSPAIGAVIVAVNVAVSCAPPEPAVTCT